MKFIDDGCYHTLAMHCVMGVCDELDFSLWTRIFHMRPHSMARLAFCLLLKNHLKKNGLESPLILFYFKREKQNKKKKTLNVTPDKKRQVWEKKV